MGSPLHWGGFLIDDFRFLVEFRMVLVIIGGQLIIRRVGRDNRKINCKGLDYEKR